MDIDEMNAEHVKAILYYLEDDTSDNDTIKAFCELTDFVPYSGRSCTLKDGLTVSFVAHQGGEEQGSEFYDIFKFEEAGKADVFVKFEGYYQSYEGVSYESDALKKVKPTEKTVIVYE